jgi:TRAP-type C4-dicarboxylate transport system substrate-binding protein
VLSVAKASAGRAACAALMLASILLSPFAARAQPVTLKLAFLTSDQSQLYLGLAKPFLDEMRRGGGGLVNFDVYLGGAIERAPDQQAQILLDGRADVSAVAPSLRRDLFPDEGVIELPGLFRDVREASLVHTRLAAANVMRGYDKFVVIGAVATQPETIHSRKPIASLADIRGQKLRVNNDTAAAFVAKLGATADVMSANFAAEAIASRRVDGALLQVAQLSDFGVGRLVTNHYLLGVGSAPLVLLMSRSSFDKLPEAAQKLIREFSGEWIANRYAEVAADANKKVIDQYMSERRRKVVTPTPDALAESARIAEAVAQEWAAQSPRNAELLARARAEIATIRAGK